MWNGAFFGMLAAGKDAGMADSPSSNFVLGLVSGSVATILNNPLDVAKTRVQSQHAAEAALPPRASVVLSWQIFCEEGWRGIGRGLPARLMRSAPGHGLLYMAFEYCSGRLRKIP